MSQNCHLSEHSQKVIRSTAVIVLRVIVGAVFILSGFTKSVDPWGFIYKIEEYLMTWGIDVPRNIILVGAIGLSAYEFMFGAMLVLGGYRRGAPRALLLTMAVMLPLTAYIAIANPVSDCGCFGDWLKLSNWATFIKNIFLTAALVYLVKNNSKIAFTLLRPSLQWIAAAACSIYIMIISIAGYLIQPMIDFRPYKTGSILWETADDDDQSIDNAVFVYEKGGEVKEFSLENIPDSTWTFVERRLPAEISSGRAAPDSFAVYDEDEDATYLLADADQPILLITIPEPVKVDIATIYTVNELASVIEKAGGTTFGLIAGSDATLRRWEDISMADYTLLTCDDTTLKSLVRGNPGIVIIDDDEVKLKRSASSIDIELLKQLASDPQPTSTAIIGRLTPWIDPVKPLTIILVILLSVLGGGSLLFHRFAGKSKKNH